jgi:hypothetical protein
MKDVLFGVLNWDRDPVEVRKRMKVLPGPERDKVVCTNQVDKWKEIGFNGRLIEADESVAKSKNLILKSLDNSQKFCFIIEDDVIITNANVITKYRKLMNDFDLNFMCYGYHNHMNRVLDMKPNPCIIMNDGTGREHYFHRSACAAFQVFRNIEYITYYDERLTCLESEFMISDFVKNKDIPFNGFLQDIPESWKYFDRPEGMERVRQKNQQKINEDINIRKTKIQLDNSADAVMKFIMEKTTK